MKILGPEQNITDNEKTVVTVGNFDGVHRGHIALFSELSKRARDKGCKSVVVTFEPHTREVLYPELPVELLTTFEEKATLIEQCGIDYVMKIPFTQEFSELSPDQFVETILIDKLHATDWVMGEGHAVGKNRSGGKKFLHEAMGRYHITIFAADLYTRNTTVVSSTQIRKLIVEGRIAEAVGMLGHPYLITTERVEGIKLGVKLGFPTLNFRKPPSQKVLPPPGVYAASLSHGAANWNGALYFGECPTFTHREAHFEFHALALDRGTPPEPGERAHLWLYEFIRGDMGFADAQELAARIKKDIIKIRTIFTQENAHAFDQGA